MPRTTRDEIWMRALDRTVKGEERVTPAEVAESVEASERTVRECLLSMYESGYLDRHSSPSGEVRYSSPEFLK
jgi:MarR-like DNA-binding transcriptional regulator SgrR of sgrS sRNA